MARLSAIGFGAEIGLDPGDHFLEQNLLELRAGSAAGASSGRSGQCAAWRTGAAAAVFHDDDHRLRLAGGNQIVEDEIHVALRRPAALILAGAVQQVEHGIALVAILVVARRRVNEAPPPGVADVRMHPLDANFAVGHVLGVVEVDALVRDFDAAPHVADAEEAFAVGVGRGKAVDDQLVIVEAGIERASCAGPDTVVILLELDVAEAHADTFRLRRIDAKIGPPLRVDPWIVATRRIRRSGMGVVGKSGVLRDAVSAHDGQKSEVAKNRFDVILRSSKFERHSSTVHS